MNYPQGRWVAAVIAIGAVTAVFLWIFYPSVTTKNPITPATTITAHDKSAEILRSLFPNGDWPEVGELDRFERTEVIRVLSETKAKANNERATAIAFLLAALGHEYNSNRDLLYSAISKCTDFNCRATIAEYLMELGRRGDVSVLPTLFDIAAEADGHFAETLGGFYSDMLAERRQEFLKMLSPLPKKEQGNPCNHAGWEDGGGMGEERVNEVRRSLNELMRDETLASVARRCLSGLRRLIKQQLRIIVTYNEEWKPSKSLPPHSFTMQCKKAGSPRCLKDISQRG